MLPIDVLCKWLVEHIECCDLCVVVIVGSLRGLVNVVCFRGLDDRDTALSRSKECFIQPPCQDRLCVSPSPCQRVTVVEVATVLGVVARIRIRAIRQNEVTTIVLFLPAWGPPLPPDLSNYS